MNIFKRAIFGIIKICEYPPVITCLSIYLWLILPFNTNAFSFDSWLVITLYSTSGSFKDITIKMTLGAADINGRS